MLKMLLPRKTKQSKIKQDKTEHYRLFLLTNLSVVLHCEKYSTTDWLDVGFSPNNTQLNFAALGYFILILTS